MKNGETLYLGEIESKFLELMAKDCPYFIIAQKETNKGIKVYSSVTEGFDIDFLFEWIKYYAREDKDFRNALCDYIIDLSKEL